MIARIKELERLRGLLKLNEITAVDRALASANKQLETASTTLPGIDDGMERLIRQTDRFADSAADAFTDFVFGAKSAREALGDLLREMAKLFYKKASRRRFPTCSAAQFVVVAGWRFRFRQHF